MKQTLVIVCERAEDGSRFNTFTTSPSETLRTLRTTAQGHYRPVGLIRVYERVSKTARKKHKKAMKNRLWPQAWFSEQAHEKGRPMTGFFATLTHTQKAKALAYRGDENHGSEDGPRESEFSRAEN